MPQIRPFRHSVAAAGLAALSLVPALPATAQDAAQFSLDLNTVGETTGGGCRLTFVANNGTGQELAQTAYEVAVFDAGGGFKKLLVLQFGALTVGKTKVVQFDLADLGCADMGQIIVNNVAACTLADGTGESEICMSGLVTSSRTTIQFSI